MDPSPEMSTAPTGEEDEWELINDDGFVYKRKKRRRLNDADHVIGDPPDPAGDPEAEERNLRRRKQRILLKLKRKYKMEMDAWESLLNNLNAVKEKASLPQIRPQEEERRTEEDNAASFPASSSNDVSTKPSLVDELLFLAQGQEAIIQDVSNLCDFADQLCKEREEERNQELFDLQIWGSPTDLMLSLCYDD